MATGCEAGTTDRSGVSCTRLGMRKVAAIPMQNIAELAAQKSFLRTIVENKCNLPEDLDPYTFAKALLPNFASTDEELRDILSYPIMAQTIMGEHDQERLTGAQLEDLLLTSIDKDHLF